MSAKERSRTFVFIWRWVEDKRADLPQAISLKAFAASSANVLLLLNRLSGSGYAYLQRRFVMNTVHWKADFRSLLR